MGCENAVPKNADDTWPNETRFFGEVDVSDSRASSHPCGDSASCVAGGGAAARRSSGGGVGDAPVPVPAGVAAPLRAPAAAAVPLSREILAQTRVAERGLLFEDSAYSSLL